MQVESKLKTSVYTETGDTETEFNSGVFFFNIIFTFADLCSPPSQHIKLELGIRDVGTYTRSYMYDFASCACFFFYTKRIHSQSSVSIHTAAQTQIPTIYRERERGERKLYIQKIKQQQQQLS